MVSNLEEERTLLYIRKMGYDILGSTYERDRDRRLDSLKRLELNLKNLEKDKTSLNEFGSCFGLNEKSIIQRYGRYIKYLQEGKETNFLPIHTLRDNLITTLFSLRYRYNIGNQVMAEAYEHLKNEELAKKHKDKFLEIIY